MTFEKRFCVAKINITHFISTNSSTRFPFFDYAPLYTFLAGDKTRHNIMIGTFDPKSRRVLSMQKCIDIVVPKTRERNRTKRGLALWPTNPHLCDLWLSIGLFTAVNTSGCLCTHECWKWHRRPCPLSGSCRWWLWGWRCTSDHTAGPSRCSCSPLSHRKPGHHRFPWPSPGSCGLRRSSSRRTGPCRCYSPPPPIGLLPDRELERGGGCRRSFSDSLASKSRL